MHILFFVVVLFENWFYDFSNGQYLITFILQACEVFPIFIKLVKLSDYCYLIYKVYYKPITLFNIARNRNDGLNSL